MKTIENAQGAIKAFTDQVLIICAKNDIEKQTLGAKIGEDSGKVFVQIKNKTFRPEPVTYFKLEKELCGKDGCLKSKLRSKYERTLKPSEMVEYLNLACGKVKQPKVKTIKTEGLGDISDEAPKRATMFKRSKPDKAARRKFYDIVVEAASKVPGVTITELNRKALLNKCTINDVKRGVTFVPVDRFEALMEYCHIEKGSDIYNELLDLELSCIAGTYEDRELAVYEKLYGGESENQEETMGKETKDTSKTRKEFSDILTKYLFLNGYNFKNAANRIGCSEQEFKDVIDGKICLSPYHVNRFKRTLEMPEAQVNELIKLANECYERHEIPEKILEYIGSDSYIIDILEYAAQKNVSAAKWKEVKGIL